MKEKKGSKKGVGLKRQVNTEELLEYLKTNLGKSVAVTDVVKGFWKFAKKDKE